MGTFRWGILATGNIAGSMAQALSESCDAELLAVASRSAEKAQTFGDVWSIPRRYDSYEALIRDADIEIVYIATPHSLHAENMRMCLTAGKHVLCEKPLTINAREAAECIALARQQGVFLMEAVWMRFFPAMHRVRGWLTEGILGSLHWLQADFCLHVPWDPAHRLYDLQLGGGALLDLGIYPLSFTTMLLGFPDKVDGRAQIGRTGVDEFNALTLSYGNDITAQLASGMRAYKPHEAVICGSQGYVSIPDPFYHPDCLVLHLHGQSPETHDFPHRGNGYEYEIEEVHTCLRDGRQREPNYATR